jgi:hypothetical protein
MSKISLDEFIAKTKGTQVALPNGEYKGQCVSLVQQYINQCLGQPATARGDAKTWITSYVNEGLGHTTSDQKKGDILVFPNEANGYGHIAIYIDANTLYDQNNTRHDKGLAGYGKIFSNDYVTLRPNEDKYLRYRAQGEDYGWQDWVNEGETAGTTGQSKRLEAIQIDTDLEVHAKAQMEGIGWKDYGIITKDTIIGTVGEWRRLECLCLKGDFKYRVHVEGTGWTQWTLADGITTMGTTGQSLRLEAIEIKRN